MKSDYLKVEVIVQWQQVVYMLSMCLPFGWHYLNAANFVLFYHYYVFFHLTYIKSITLK